MFSDHHRLGRVRRSSLFGLEQGRGTSRERARRAIVDRLIDLALDLQDVTVTAEREEVEEAARKLTLSSVQFPCNTLEGPMPLHGVYSRVRRPAPAVTATPLPLRAAQYLRMSTEHQQYSTENQSDVIRRYAQTHGIEIVRTYSDEGKSGLNINERPGLRGRLRLLLERHGQLNTRIIDSTNNVPGSGTYRRRFGTLRRAYALIGYTRPEDYRYMDARMELRNWWMEQRALFVTKLREQGAKIEPAGSSSILINNEFTATFLMLLCRKTKGGDLRWNIQLRGREISDITVAVRLTPDNKNILDFYVFPKAEIATRSELTLGIPGPLESYRFKNLDFLTGAARRTLVEEVSCIR